MAMTQASQLTLLPQFSRFLAQRMGLHFPPERWSDLQRGLTAAAREFNFEDVSSCMEWLLSTSLQRSQIETLASHLTIGETYFFREPRVFEALQTQILPTLIESRRKSDMRLRIWSAACSTGEEAYSIAILLQRLLPDYKQWNITILGTDINPLALRKAATGIYGDWSFRNAPSWLRESYFLPLGGGRYQVVSDVRDMVTFSYLNLAEDAYPSFANNTNAMDIIFCRNVLMYFDTDLAAEVVRRHFLSLDDGGWMIVSPVEASLPVFAELETVHFPGAALFRKNSVHATWATVAASFEQPTILDTPKTRAVAKPRAALKKPTLKAMLPVPAEASAAAYGQALILYQQGCYTEAAKHIDKLITDWPDHADALHLMVRIHANQGELSTALHWCERSIAADRVNPVGYYLMAVVLQEQKQADAAMLALKRTLYLDSEFVMAHFMLASLYRNQARTQEAGKCFTNTLSLLKGYALEEVLPEAEGITAGRLTEIIRTLTDKKAT